jgi:hypothetical protein
VSPDRLGKQRSESYNQARQFGRQWQHRKTSLGGVGQSAYAAFRFMLIIRITPFNIETC